MAVWISWTLSCPPVDRPAVERTAALSMREFPVTTMASGVEHAPGALSWAYREAAPAAVSASVYVAIFRITQIYTSQFGGGPRRREHPFRTGKSPSTARS